MIYKNSVLKQSIRARNKVNFSKNSKKVDKVNVKPSDIGFRIAFSFAVDACWIIRAYLGRVDIQRR